MNTPVSSPTHTGTPMVIVIAALVVTLIIVVYRALSPARGEDLGCGPYGR